MNQIRYESLAKYKYRLTDDLCLETGITGYYARTDYIEIQPGGKLVLKSGYAWDGPSGPTWDTEDSMRGSAGHDALYQLMHLGVLPLSCKDEADKLLLKWVIEDGMSEFRANYWYKGVSLFGRGHI